MSLKWQDRFRQPLLLLAVTLDFTGVVSEPQLEVHGAHATAA
jgi:hypothetical protein